MRAPPADDGMAMAGEDRATAPKVWRAPSDASQVAERLAGVCAWAQEWSHRDKDDMVPDDAVMLGVLAESARLLGRDDGMDVETAAAVLHIYARFWEGLYGIATHDIGRGYVPVSPWPPTPRSIAATFFGPHRSHLPPAQWAIAVLAEFECQFARHRSWFSRNVLCAASRQQAVREERVQLAYVAVGMYADGSRHVSLWHSIAANYRISMIDVGAYGRWAGAVVAIGRPALAGVVELATHHDLPPAIACYLHGRAADTRTPLVTQAGSALAVDDLRALRDAARRLVCLVQRFAARPMDLAAAAAITIARNGGRLAESMAIARLCLEMRWLVVAARLLAVEAVTPEDAAASMLDAARMLGIEDCDEMTPHKVGICVAMALASCC
ncbi:hypothetical protein psal_cds_450 [Pandoravirus salinus]|uniref:DUF5848 domain-containing protein n=1 Tax=Pandoravirus salinus TaxID=1349410 RepID=S4VUH8_9VIRU|nr:hypothetical protein psal_cds_450 [Pandoravirus salinus]AGO84204.1 hypothetical protein psal_cds_450 [Pandoravirus salinus]